MKKLGFVLSILFFVCWPIAAQTQQIIRVNAGGPAYSDTKGQLWSADHGYNTGALSRSAKSATVTGTSDPTLFKSARYAPLSTPELQYQFALANGTYKVNLYFAEVFWTTKGKRVFDVQMQGATVFSGLDIFAAVGADHALVKSAVVSVTNGTIIIRFVHHSNADNPIISALEILPSVASSSTAPPTITTSSLPLGNSGKAYSTTLQASGGTAPYSWSISSGSLPAGLTLSSSGQISGTPTTAATSSFTVKATDSSSPAQSKTASLSITVTTAATPVQITTSSLSGGQVNSSYSITLTASGGTSPYSWSISSGSLPAGLSLDSTTGGIAGVLTTAATFSFTAQVADSSGLTASKPFSIVVTSTGTGGCGVTGTYPNLTQLDQSTCGNVTTDGSILSYESNYHDSTAIDLNSSGCGNIYSLGGPVSFKLTANLNCGPNNVAFAIQPSNGSGGGYYVNLNGFTITGTVTVNDNNGGFPDGTHFFGGNWTCSARPCLNIFWTNGADIVSNPITIHHISWANSSDNGEMVSIGADGAGLPQIPYTIIQHHNTCTLSGGTAGDPNRTSCFTENGTMQYVAYYNNLIQNAAGTNHGASEGMVCYNAAKCDVHNNWISFNQMTLSNGTPGRGILLDGDGYGNGPSASVTSSADIYNNYCSVQNTRCVRARSAANFLIHDNLVDNCTDGNNNVSYQACLLHWGDPTADQGSSATYDYGAAQVKNNLTILVAPVSSGGRVHWGNNATGIAFQDERIGCVGTGCSSNSRDGAYLFSAISNKSGSQFFNITVCSPTYDQALLEPVFASGAGETQDSTISSFSVGPMTISGGVTEISLGSCQ